MSDEESFIILGTSPNSIMQNCSWEAKKSTNSFMHLDSPNLQFQSLEKQQLNILKNALDAVTGKLNQNVEQIEMAKKMALAINTSANNQQEKSEAQDDRKLWSRSPLVEDITSPPVKEITPAYSLEDYALQFPLEQHDETKNMSSSINQDKIKDRRETKNMSTSLKQDSLIGSTSKTVSSLEAKSRSSADSNLAASFIMGEVTSDVLKNSVYSQFPSISMEASEEDLNKLQKVISEHAELRETIRKANSTMKKFKEFISQSKKNMKAVEEQYKQELDTLRNEIEELRKKNKEMENSFKMQIEAVEIAQKKDHLEHIQKISEKNSIMENMRAQIVKLEEQQLENNQLTASKFFVPQLKGPINRNSEVIEDLLNENNICKKQMLQLKTQVKEDEKEIERLTTLNEMNQSRLQTLEDSIMSLKIAYEEQKERIQLLETQNELHRADFEVEKNCREEAVKEKQRILQDLRMLQHKNHLLIEDHQKMVNDYQRRFSGANSIDQNNRIVAASAAAQDYFGNPQRPIRLLPSGSSYAPHTEPETAEKCPVCKLMK